MRNGGGLTPAEMRIVRAILNGHTSTVELVAALPAGRAGRISARTLQSHIANIYAKTGAFNKADLVLMALGGKDCEIDLARQVAEPVARKRGRDRYGRTAAQ